MLRRIAQFLTYSRTGLAPLWLLLVAFVAALAYANSLHNGFVLDDGGIIVNNPAVQRLQWNDIWSQNYWPSTDGFPGDLLYRPLTLYSYLANQYLAPGNVLAFHGVNILLHALNCALVAALAWRLFRSAPAAVIGGILFAVHPLHTEVVANVVGRAELLAALGSLAALLFYLPADPFASTPPPRRGWWHGGLVAACLLFAILCKETPLMLCVGFVAIDVLRWTRFSPDSRPTLVRWFAAQTLRYYLPVGIAVGFYLALRIHAIGLMIDANQIHPLVNPLIESTIAQRIVTPFMLLAKYFVLFFWPATLAADYSAPSLMPTANPFMSLALLGEVIVLAGLFLTYSNWRRRPALVLSIILFALGYILVANVIRIGTIFGERLFYWPSVFVCIWAGLAAAELFRYAAALPRPRLSRAAIAAFLLVIATLFTARTWARNPDWSSNESMAIATAMDNPNSSKSMGWAGLVLVCSDPQKINVNGQTINTIDFGEQLLLKAIDLYPTNGRVYWDLAAYYERAGRSGESLVYLCKAATSGGGHNRVHSAILYTRDDLRHKPQSAYLPFARTYAAAHPDDAPGQLALALASRAAGKPDDATYALSKALKLMPLYHEAGSELGLERLEHGDAAGAVELLRKYALYAGDNADARCQLVFALLKLDHDRFPGALDEARRCLNSAAAIDPDGHASQLQMLRAELDKKQKSIAAAPIVTPPLQNAHTGASNSTSNQHQPL